MKKVPLVIYEKGKRKVVGEAVVEMGNGMIDILGTVDFKYASALQEELLKGITIGSFSIANPIKE